MIRVAISHFADTSQMNYIMRSRKSNRKLISEGHGGQSTIAEFFFRFDVKKLDSTPYTVNDQDVIQTQPEESQLNLILNAKWSRTVSSFLRKGPINCKEDNFELFDDVTDGFHIKIQESFNILFNGYIRESEDEMDIKIPSAVWCLIKSNIKVRYAWFYCTGFRNPLL